MDFKCGHCETEFNELSKTIDHCIIFHEDLPLSYSQLVLHDQSGKLQYRVKQYGIVPAKAHSEGKIITFNDATGKLAVVDSTDVNLIKGETSETNNLADELEKLRNVLPKAAQRLKDQGHLSTWLQLHRLIADGSFPLNNICFRLFLDIVKLHCCPSLTEMRYPEHSKVFWRTAYRLFGGKLMRFMGGPKCQGQGSGGSACTPSEAKVNFSVPSRSVLEDVHETSETPRPGIIFSNMQTLATTTKSAYYQEMAASNSRTRKFRDL